MSIDSVNRPTISTWMRPPVARGERQLLPAVWSVSPRPGPFVGQGPRGPSRPWEIPFGADLDPIEMRHVVKREISVMWGFP
jgi:hypothetical protein